MYIGQKRPWRRVGGKGFIVVWGALMLAACTDTSSSSPDGSLADVMGRSDTSDEGGRSGDQQRPADISDSSGPREEADDGPGLDLSPVDLDDPRPCHGQCTPDLCDPTTDTCWQCARNEQCTYPAWCRDHWCAVTACYPGAIWCDGAARLTCGDDGESMDMEPCGQGETCANGICLPQVCPPGESGCANLQVKACNDTGTGYQYYPCPPGSACYGDRCALYKHNVVLIFDTSSSMSATGPLDAIDCICPEGCPLAPYPACENGNCPMSKLGLAKWAFNQLFATTEAANVNFAMIHFPQRIRQRSSESCSDMMGVGWYEPPLYSDFIEGDDDSHVTPADSYFDGNLWQILSVPFPRTEADDSLSQAHLWMDLDEQMASNGQFCLTAEDCPGGTCTLSGGSQSCHFHSNPELRAAGNTPLGRSLFYAGEYIRKHVVVDGKPCTVDADCGNVNYLCAPEGTCYDPFRACRATVVVLFTDGVEEPATDPSNFFNPRVQAKRLRYGLGCTEAADCLEGAVCQGGTCQGYETPNSATPSPIQYDDLQQAEVLRDFTGRPIQVTTHVIDMSGGQGAEANAHIADEGGGMHFQVGSDQPEAFFETLVDLFDIKAYLGQCVPPPATTETNAMR